MESKQRYNDLVSEIKKEIKEIDVDEVKKLQNDNNVFKLIDIREEVEWNKDSIPGAVFIPRGILEREIESAVPDTYVKIILYCAAGFRSVLSAFNLQKMGYKDVYSMREGISGWAKKGLPINIKQ